MAKCLILWEMDPAVMPKDPAEQMAVFGKLGQITKSSLDSGKVKDWGIFAGGWAGYSIIDEPATETLTRSFQFTPYVKLKVNPVVGINDVMQIMQSMPK
jgi:hypothetical protein